MRTWHIHSSQVVPSRRFVIQPTGRWQIVSEPIASGLIPRTPARHACCWRLLGTRFLRELFSFAAFSFASLALAD